MTALRAQFDKELERKPYEFSQKISHAQYVGLVKGISRGYTCYMTDDEALHWICRGFGFDRSQVTILNEIDEQEINRHNLCHASGQKIDRRPGWGARTIQSWEGLPSNLYQFK